VHFSVPINFADDLEFHIGLVKEDEANNQAMVAVEKLPSDIAIACLLHPLVGGKLHVCKRNELEPQRI
jgi:hypothetical protein